MQTHRIPSFNDKSFDGMLAWFSEMSVRGLLFHPDDDPATIYQIKDNVPTFVEAEVNAARQILDEMFDLHSDDVYEAAYPIFMNKMGLRLDA